MVKKILQQEAGCAYKCFGPKSVQVVYTELKNSGTISLGTLQSV